MCVLGDVICSLVYYFILGWLFLFIWIILESDLREIKHLLYSMDKKLDSLLDRGDTNAMMRLSEYSLRDFLLDEPVS